MKPPTPTDDPTGAPEAGSGAPPTQIVPWRGEHIAALHERVSVLITTNLPFSDWVQVLGDERLTSGLLDRLTFRCHILEFLGDSFRFRHALERQASAGAADGLVISPVG